MKEGWTVSQKQYLVSSPIWLGMEETSSCF